MAQSIGDINGLVSAAAQFSARGARGTQHAMSLDLHKIKGESALVPGALMTKALDIQRWTFSYNIGPGADGGSVSGDGAATPVFKSASCKCVNSLFSDFHLSARPITATKSIQDTWIAATLEQAIQSLNNQGYVRGFSDVELERPDSKLVPDGFVYIFTCPWERTRVAVSAANGAVTWLEQY
jgi:hypothetical protein